LVDPWGDWPDWLATSSLVPDEERGDYLKPDFLKRVAPLDPVQWFSRVTATVRLQYLSEPSVTPWIVRERIAAAAPPHTKVMAHHEAVAQYRAASRMTFFDWIKDQLRLAPAHERGPA
jgi:hypothetical protein